MKLFSKAPEPQPHKFEPTLASLDELLAIKRQVDDEIVARQETEVAALRARAEGIADALGLPVGQMLGIKAETVARKPKRQPKVQYRDTEDPANTWTGKGRVPKWLQDKIDQGADKEQFAVS